MQMEEAFEGQLALFWTLTINYYLPLFQEILSVGVSFALCVSSLDLNLCSTFALSSRPNCCNSICINRAASSGGSSSWGEFVIGELVTSFQYSYRRINYLYFLLKMNSVFCSYRCSDDIGLYGSGQIIWIQNVLILLKKFVHLSVLLWHVNVKFVVASN